MRTEEIIHELKIVQAFIKDDDEHCPDYGVTKNVYNSKIQRAIDKLEMPPTPGNKYYFCTGDKDAIKHDKSERRFMAPGRNLDLTIEELG